MEFLNLKDENDLANVKIAKNKMIAYLREKANKIRGKEKRLDFITSKFDKMMQLTKLLFDIEEIQISDYMKDPDYYENFQCINPDDNNQRGLFKIITYAFQCIDDFHSDENSKANILTIANILMDYTLLKYNNLDEYIDGSPKEAWIMEEFQRLNNIARGSVIEGVLHSFSYEDKEAINIIEQVFIVEGRLTLHYTRIKFESQTFIHMKRHNQTIDSEYLAKKIIEGGKESKQQLEYFIKIKNIFNETLEQKTNQLKQGGQT